MGAPKLSTATREEIVNAYISGEPLKQIALRFGVHLSYPGLLYRRYFSRKSLSGKGQKRRKLWTEGKNYE